MESDSDRQRQPDPRELGKRGSTLGWLAVFFIVVTVGSIIVPNCMRVQSRQNLMSCRSNLKNIATALEIYGADHPGELPRQLLDLSPAYLRRVPVCPAAERDTYSETYQVSTAGILEPGLSPRFRLHCEGVNHLPVMGEDLPAYDSEDGMQDRSI